MHQIGDDCGCELRRKTFESCRIFRNEIAGALRQAEMSPGIPSNRFRNSALPVAVSVTETFKINAHCILRGASALIKYCRCGAVAQHLSPENDVASITRK